MAYSEKLANRVRTILVDHPTVEKKKMMSGLIFMVNNKMCVGILQDDLMVRIDPAEYEFVLGKQG
jgi:TfoX/Sxy family transcriptional regulator of competence genes